jgi:tRNA(Arg) A34 adenosine deaminase TadA
MLNDTDLTHLRRCVALAAEALAAGDEPFGSLLVAADGAVLAEERNRVVSAADRTRHPEFELARWAVAHLTPAQRAAATVYTSGEHCPMCAAAHGWAGLGRIVYASSSEQLTGWMAELGVPPSPVRPLRIREVVPSLAVAGPAPELARQVRELHHRFHGAGQPTADASQHAHDPWSWSGHKGSAALAAPTTQAHVAAAERELGVKLPREFRERLMARNGGDLATAGDDWLVFPVPDTTTRGTSGAAWDSSAHLVAQNRAARERKGFPPGAVAIATNRAGDLLVLVPKGDSGQFEPRVMIWKHETGECVATALRYEDG